MVSQSLRDSFTPTEVRSYQQILLISWSAIVVISLFWNLKILEGEAFDAARSMARGAFEKDVAYREWNARNGGVYVPVTPETQPNPYLDVANRDVETRSDMALTMVNPAYMNRQVNEIGQLSGGLLVGHLTSLKPIRPANNADEWEAEALRAIEAGAAEEGGLDVVGGVSSFRFMFPLYVEKSCLKCHQHQGYSVGDVRGGIGYTVPAAVVTNLHRGRRITLILWHTVFWVVGVAGILIGRQTIKQTVLQRMEVEQSLHRSRERFEFFYGDAQLGYQTLDATGTIVEVNDTWVEITGYSKKHARGMWFGDLLAPESSGLFEADFAAATEGGTTRDAEYTIVRRDGVRLALSFWRKVELNPDGTCHLAHFIVADLKGQ